MSENISQILFLLAAVLVTYYYRSFYLNNDSIDTGNEFTSIERDIIKSWKRYIHLPNRNLKRNYRIAIGMNTNVDLIVSGPELLKTLEIVSTNKPKNCEQVNSLSEFKDCFQFFFRKGSAAERSFRSLNDFNTVIDATNDLEQRYFIGGNAGLMAESITSKLKNVDVYLIGPVGPKLKSLLNTEIIVPSLIEKDEIHLILEYSANEMYEEVKAPAANRFIVSHDVINSNMQKLNEFFEVINSAEPDLIILSGLHLLESQEAVARLDKLESLRNLLAENHMSRNVVHLELASIGDKTLMKSILDLKLLHEIDSLGLNEQELLFLSHSSQKAPHSNYYNEISGQPDLLKIIDILDWILNTYGKSQQNPTSRLTRIHFHCLIFHIIVVKENQWSNTDASLMAGAKIASKQASGLEFHNEQNENQLEDLVGFKFQDTNKDQALIRFQISTNEFMTFNSNKPVSEFQRGDNQFYFTPVLVCKKPLKTVGLGDAISSIGLAYSSFNHATNITNFSTI